MKKFTTAEIRDLYGQVTMGEISFSRMVEVLNQRVSERVEEIPIRKFKKGDKVRIKHGISSKTHGSALPNFRDSMDEFIGRKLTIDMYTSEDRVVFSEDERRWRFSEDWLEPYVEELKEGDLAIFWNDDKKLAAIRIYDDRSNESEEYFWYKDSPGFIWANAIKFESKEQFKRLIKGEI